MPSSSSSSINFSSSSSSVDSSSSSSSFSFSGSSSSSSGYCQYPICEGDGCFAFSNWYLEGLSIELLGSNQIFVRYNDFGSIQQVELYSDTNYLNLIAIGQGTVGTINLEARNGSGVTGSVDWNGTSVSYLKQSILYCETDADSIFSSSSSSVDSSSSSSLSLSSLSSSSSNCCINYNCHGHACNHFSGWEIYNANDRNSDGCDFYVGFDFQDGYQEVRIYKDENLSELVAIGQRNSAGTISLSQVNASGLVGLVIWSGTSVSSPNIAYLSCLELSSSSSSSSEGTSSSSSLDSSSSSSIDSSSSSTSVSESSSSSSIDSSSSSSSSSERFSSSSSMSYSSSSSETSLTSSSSSSIDSSSSSSESVGNISSSSSSSVIGETWNRSKQLILAKTSISKGGYNNRLGQIVSLNETSYSVGDVYLHLQGPYGKSNNLILHLDIYEVSSFNVPTSLIATSSLNVVDVNSSGWNKFSFNLSNLIAPSSKKIAFVFRQEGGDENNYVSWSYVKSLGESSVLLSSNNADWAEEDDIAMLIRVLGIFDPYDLDEFRITSPPAPFKTKIDDLPENLTATLNDLLVSIVIDDSGSMSWNDRSEKRKQVAQKIYEKFVNYPKEVLFDIIKFGSSSIDLDLAVASPNFLNIKKIYVDVNSPNINTFEFGVSSQNFSKGDVYSSSGINFTIVDKRSGLLVAEGSEIPNFSGTLSRVSGNGTTLIDYFNVFENSIENSNMISYGFANLTLDRTFNVAGVFLGGSPDSSKFIDSETNWRIFNSDNEFSLNQNGPNDSLSIDFNTDNDLIISNTFSKKTVDKVDILGFNLKGNSEVFVGENSFVVGDYVDFRGEFSSYYHEVTEVKEESIIINPPLKMDIDSTSNSNTYVSLSTFLQGQNFLSETTIEILIRDVEKKSGEEVLFYLENSQGYKSYYLITPSDKWEFYQFFWNDQTAPIKINLIDNDGNPMPDGLEVKFYIEDLAEKLETKFSNKIVVDAFQGDSTLFLDGLEGIDRNVVVKIVNGNSKQFNEVIEFDLNEDGEDDYPSIVLQDPIDFDVGPSNDGGKVEVDLSAKNTNALSLISDSSLETSTALPFVDVTPIVEGINLPSSALQLYDNPVDKNSNFEDINLNQSLIKTKSSDFPTINGKNVIRFLPITEDILKTNSEKEKEAGNLLKLNYFRGFNSEIENSDLLDVSEENVRANVEENGKDKDYNLVSPVYSKNGVATSYLSTYALEYEEEVNLNPPVEYFSYSSINKLLAKKYTVHSKLEKKSDTGVIESAIHFPETEVDFVPPVSIQSEFDFDNDGLLFFKPERGGEFSLCKTVQKYSTQKESRGIYAGSSSPIKVTYLVSNKFRLIKSGTLNVTIYSNKQLISKHEDIVVGEYPSPAKPVKPIYSSEHLNYSLPPKYQLNEDGELVQIFQETPIDFWRNSVAQNNNPSDDFDDFDPPEEEKSEIEKQVEKAFEEVQVSSVPSNFDIGSEIEEGKDMDLAYAAPKSFTYATDLEEYTFSIPVKNGKAVLEIDTPDEVGILLFEASYSYGTEITYEAIRTDWFFVENPLQIGPFQPMDLRSDGKTEYDLFNEVYFRGAPVVEDGASVEISSDIFSPSVGIVEDSIAKGQKTKPKDPYIYKEESAELCGSNENIPIVIRNSSEYELRRNRFLFYKNASGGRGDYSDRYEIIGEVKGKSGKKWADGENFSLTFDIRENFDLLYQLPEDLVDFLLGKSSRASSPASIFTVGGRKRLSPDGTMEIKLEGVDKNVGNIYLARSGTAGLPTSSPQKFSFLLNPDSSYGSDDVFYNLATNSPVIFVDEEGKAQSIDVKIAVPGIINESGEDINPSTLAKFQAVELVEPLSINTYAESFKGTFVRDGEASPYFIADVQWKDNFIKEKVIINEGEEDEFVFDFGFPQISFESGVCGKANAYLEDKSEDIPPIPIDSRGTVEDCLRIESFDGFELNAYEVDVGLFRTSFIIEIKNSESIVECIEKNFNEITADDWDLAISIHCHATTVDSLGNGYTTETIVLKGTIENHYHDIQNYVILEQQPFNFDSHSHSLRSVAITQVLPSTNQSEDMEVKATVIYDPTNCEPYRDEEKVPYQNRMMFASSTLHAGTVPDKFLTLNLSTQFSFLNSSTGIRNNASYLLADNVDDVESGFEVRTLFRYIEATSQEEADEIAKLNSIVGDFVDDGTRIKYKTTVFIANQGNINRDTNTDVVSFVLKIDAQGEYNGKKASDSLIISLVSSKALFDNIISLLPEFSNDKEYINNSFNSISPFGESKVYDALKLANDRMVDLLIEDSKYENYSKLMILLSDNEENKSSTSYSQMIQNILDIKNNPVQIVPINLGNISQFEKILAEKLQLDTNSFGIETNNFKYKNPNQVVEEIFSNKNLTLKQTMLTTTTVFPQKTKVIDISLPNVDIPEGASIEYRLRIFNDNREELTQFKPLVDDKVEIDSFATKVDIEYKLILSENFETPTISENVEVNYLDPKEIYIFFKPIVLNLKDNEYISSIIINHEANIPEDSEIKYGLTQFRTSDPSYFYSTTQPEIQAHRQTILNTRYNELLISENGKEFFPINGKWNSLSEFTLYDENGLEVNPSSYVAEPELGRIIFNSSKSLNNKYYIDIELSNRFKIYARIKNYGEESAQIEHIGVSYNISKRFE